MATQTTDNLEPAMRNLEINNENTEMNSNGNIDNKWGLPLEEVYRLALRFYKEKDGTKAVQLSYKDRIKLVAYTKQVLYGKYRADVSPEVGFLDVVGNDRRQAWLSLGDLSKTEAMTEFIKYLDQLCPLFMPYVDAHKAEKQEQIQKQKEEEERLKREEEEKERRLLEDEVRQRQEDDRNRQLQQEMAIRAALNQQTAVQFKQYAEQQYPGNKEQQEALIAQLQEQHFQQYMQQVYQQQLLHQQQQYQQLQTMTDPSKAQQQQVPAQPEAPTQPQVPPEHAQVALQSQVPPQPQTPSQQTPAPPHPVPAAGSDGTQELTQVAQAVTGNGVDPMTSHGTQVLQNNIGDAHRKNAVGEGNEEDSEQNLPPIAAASMWTRKDVKEFKESIRKDPDSLIKVGSGETITVRVPTHEDGTCLFWEFATDNYDIGFGVYFEWTIAPNNQVSVHVSESSDEDDLDEEEGETGRGDGDVERGKKTENRPPTDEIIPVYRRDCHQEVYCGSHMYPGRGVYLLKFDNSYSLWRSKCLYYRVYYTR